MESLDVLAKEYLMSGKNCCANAINALSLNLQKIFRGAFDETPCYDMNTVPKAS